MSLSFREISSSDFSDCADILMAAYEGEPWNNHWTKEEALLRIESTMSGFNARGYVAVKHDEIVAMCLGRIDYYYNNWSQYCMDEFNVKPTLQGLGIGRSLLKYVSQTMKNNQVARLFLLTGGKQAANFYQQCGFSQTLEGSMMAYDLVKQ